MTSESQMVLYAAGMLLAANVLAVILHFLYKALSDGPLRDFIRSIIYELDRFADNMENSQKRETAIQQINEVLGWRKFMIPAALIGWVIDTEVAVIRKMQAATDTPDLHKEDAIHAKSDSSTAQGAGVTEQK